MFGQSRSFLGPTSSAPAFLLLLHCCTIFAAFVLLLFFALFYLALRYFFSFAQPFQLCLFCLFSPTPRFLVFLSFIFSLALSDSIVLFCFYLSLFSFFLLFLFFLAFPNSLFLLPIPRTLILFFHSKCHLYLKSAPLTTALVLASTPPRLRAPSLITWSTTCAEPVTDLRRLRSCRFKRVVTWHAVALAGTSYPPIVLASMELSLPDQTQVRWDPLKSSRLFYLAAKR